MGFKFNPITAQLDLTGSSGSASFAAVTGNPTDNAALSTALAGKMAVAAAVITHKDGTSTAYAASANTDAARAAALTTAAAAYAAGDKIHLSAGTFDLSTSGNITFSNPVEVQGEGPGITTIKSAVAGGFAQTIFTSTGSNCVFRDMTLAMGSGSNTSGEVIGVSVTGGTAYIYNVQFQTDYGVQNGASQVTIWNSNFRDCQREGVIQVSNSGEVDLYGCDLRLSTNSYNQVPSLLRATGGTLRAFGCYISKNDGTHSTEPAITVSGTGTPGLGKLYLVGCHVDSSTNTNLAQIGAGVLYVSNTTYDTSKTTGTITQLGNDLQIGNNLSDLANAATSRANLGLAIGTNVQAYDPDLTAWAAITPTVGPLAIGLGVTAAPTVFTAGDTSSSTPRGIMSWQSSTDTASAHLQLRKSRGTFASPSTVANADIIGRVVYSAYDGSNYLEMASIRATVSGTAATTSIPTRLEFLTGSSATPSVATVALTLTNNQSAVFAGSLSFNTAASISGSSGQALTIAPGSGGTLVLTAPNLGTPTAAILTNASGTAANLTAGLVTTNANLTGDVTSVGNAATLANIPTISGVNLTNLNASNLGSGTVPTVRLGSGTANSTTVLYGDQTYKSISLGLVVGTTTITSGTSGNFLKDVSGVLQERTPAQLLSDIGAQASGSYAASGANSDITALSGLTGSVASTASTALSLSAGTPAAAAASTVGNAASLSASNATAGTSSAGAAVGGSITLTAGNAARLTSGNANGGNINLAPGSGIGTGTAGQILIPYGTEAAPSIGFSLTTNTGIIGGNNNVSFVVGGACLGTFNSSSGGLNLASSGIYGFSSGDPFTNGRDNTLTLISGSTVKSIFVATGTATTCTGATIGTGSKSNAGFVTATTTGTSTIVITFPVTAPTGWNIAASDSTAVTNMVQTASTTTTATLSGTTVSGDVIRYIAMAY